MIRAYNEYHTVQMFEPVTTTLLDVLVAKHPTFPEYGASKDGRVFRLSSSKELKETLSKTQRRVRVKLCSNGRLMHTFRYRVVYECWNGLIPAKHDIDHIDGNCSNDALANLQCLTRQHHAEKTAKACRRAPNGTSLPPIEGENWKQVSEKLEISDCGRARIQLRTPTTTFSKITLGSITEYGYRVVCAQYVHVLVANAFLPPPERADQVTVNHKDHNRQNNHMSNLEWSSRKEQAEHAVGRQVFLYDKEKDTVQVFASQKQVCDFLDVNSHTMSYYCRHTEASPFGWYKPMCGKIAKTFPNLFFLKSMDIRPKDIVLNNRRWEEEPTVGEKRARDDE